MKVHTTVLFGFLLALSGCKEVDGQLGENIEKWEGQAPQQYVHARCATLWTTRDCTRVAVDAGVVVAAQTRDPGSSWVDAPDLSAVAEPVGAMFDEVEEGTGDNLTDVSYNQQYGFVQDYTKEYGTEYAGEEVTCFVTGTTDLTACDSEVVEGSQGTP